ncbi:MAG: exopolysaccharide biosynthesis polyprenyl glycosylphosphotransferase [Planctomycetia bacterium]|nr:exopolysaccharide biosynthesis polyprenyl glycosylphosphotransferase [Planctomycetia bacterium]
MNTEQLSAGSLRTRRDTHTREASRTLELAPARPDRTAVVISRTLDVILSVLLLCVFAVPMLLIALLVKLTSRGPAVYEQHRAGLGGKPFVMFKFRTMRVDAEAETGPVWAKRGDPRRTAVGIVLRRFCLDELPQLFNVLRGEMRLVGPRPERPCFVQTFAQKIPTYCQRHQVLPGITGWAQINGLRGDSSIEERLEFDLFYIRNWSVLFDLRVLLLTPFRVLVEKNGC